MDLIFHAKGWQGQSACWSFDGFHAFRTRLVALSGVVLEEMQGFGGSRAWKGVGLGGIGELIRHFDDDGILTAGVCRRLGPNLDTLLDRMDPDQHADVKYDVEMGRVLVKMMAHCAANDVPIEFNGARSRDRRPVRSTSRDEAPAHCEQ